MIELTSRVILPLLLFLFSLRGLFRFRSLIFLLFLLLLSCLLLGSKCLRENALVLSLLVTHGLELDNVQDVAFTLWILDLLHEVGVPHVSLVSLDALLYHLGSHRGLARFSGSFSALLHGSLEALLSTSLSNLLQVARVNLLLVLADAA